MQKLLAFMGKMLIYIGNHSSLNSKLNRMMSWTDNLTSIDCRCGQVSKPHTLVEILFLPMSRVNMLSEVTIKSLHTISTGTIYEKPANE